MKRKEDWELLKNKNWVAFATAMTMVQLVLSSFSQMVLFYLLVGFLAMLIEQEWRRPWIILLWLPWGFKICNQE
jgi:hypothetical protein